MKEVKTLNALISDNKYAELNNEIEVLRKLLQLKVQKYEDFSHPEVMLISKKLDTKIFALTHMLYLKD